MLMLVLADNYLGAVPRLGGRRPGVVPADRLLAAQARPPRPPPRRRSSSTGSVTSACRWRSMLMFVTFGTVDFAGDQRGRRRARRRPRSTRSACCSCSAACGKSAQVPLQSWLLDAMEGPTPVSALIHAATMVTAGVYLVVRSNFIFERAPTRQTAVVIVGVVTLLWGAIIGCAKDDIKKALAGSTMSQIGYMMLGRRPRRRGLRVRDLPPADPRLLQGQHVPRRRLGHARAWTTTSTCATTARCSKCMPVTFLTFAMGYLAIIGVPRLLRLLVQGQDHRDRVRREPRGRAGCALLGAGITGVLHDPADADDVLHREALGRGRAPARVARR